MGIFSIFSSKKSNNDEYWSNDWPPPAASERQDSIATPLNTSLVANLFTVGIAVVAANVGLALINTPPRPTLENDWMCGLPSGGQAMLHT